jgi:hypothetical protein
MDSLVSSLFDLAYDVRNINMYCQYTFIEPAKPELTEQQSSCASTLSALDNLIQPINEQVNIEKVDLIARVLGLVPNLRKNCNLNFQWMDDMFAEAREQENFEEADNNAEHSEESLQAQDEE